MATVEIRGNSDLRKAMRRFAPDLEKNLRKEMASGLKPVVAKARGYVPAESPMSGWAARSFNQGKFPTYNASVIQRGLTYSTNVSKVNKNGFSSMAAIYNKSAVGAIYETAGRKNPNGQPWVGPKAGGLSKKVSRSNNPTAGKTFIDNLPPLVSSLQGQGRLIYRAWAEDKGRAHGIVMRALDKTLTEFYARSNAGTLGKAA
jgi:hypothetical protein